MTPEDFVTYDQAVKLKELGFRWDCNHYYDTETNTFVEYVHYNDEGYFDPDASSYYNHNCHHSSVSAPTLEQVQKWLRDVHKIEVRICMEFDVFQPKGTWESKARKFDAEFGDNILYGVGFSTYEQALSEGIDQTLELLKN